jgi:cation diffusion facilitator CzcD-associated flavoprotein CzcO
VAGATDGRTGLSRLHAATILPHHRRWPGWTGAGRAAAPPRCSDVIIERNKRAGDSWRVATSRSACMTRSGTTTVPTLSGSLAGVLAQRQDRRLAGDVRQVMELNLWTSSECRERGTTKSAEWTVVLDRAGASVTLRQAAGAGDRHVGVPDMPRFPGRSASARAVSLEQFTSVRLMLASVAS